MLGDSLASTKQVMLTADYSPNADRSGERVQFLFSNQTQQGHTYVPGKESRQSRAERRQKAIQGAEAQFPNTPSAQGHTYHNGMTGDLAGVGQQFQGQGGQ